MYEVSVQPGILLRTDCPAGTVVKTALQEQTVARLVGENLTGVLAVVQGFRYIGIRRREDDEGVFVPRIAGAAGEVFVVLRIEGMAVLQFE